MPAPIDISDFSPAFRFVAHHLASLVRPASRIDPLDVQHWPEVAAIAQRHRVDAALAQALRRSGWGAMPDDLRARLERAEKSATMAGLAQIAQTDRLATAFEAARIRFLVLKGPPLSVALFGSPNLRQSRDIDVMVDRGDIGRAVAVLETLGYERVDQHAELPATEIGSRAHAEIEHHIELMHAASGTLLELHWQPVGHELCSFSVAEVWDERGILRAHRAALPVLPDDLLLRYLACHGAKHAWFRLKWLLDIAAIMERRGQEDIARAWQDAAGEGLGPLMGSSLLLAHVIFGAPLHARVIAAASDDPAVRRLMAFASRALSQDMPISSALLLRNRFHLRTDAPYRWSVAARLLDMGKLRRAVARRMRSGGAGAGRSNRPS